MTSHVFWLANALLAALRSSKIGVLCEEDVTALLTA